MSHWDSALRSLRDTTTQLYGPTSFISYLQNIGENPNQYRTPSEISIDTYQQLSDRLKEQDTMVLRLGKANDGRGTQFVLVHVPDRLKDFFIIEKKINTDRKNILDYTSGGDDTLALNQSVRDMLDVYRSLPTFSETSFVNFGLSTGVFSQALGLDSEQIGTAPTTVASTFNFRFEPHPHCSTVVHHNGGQVEIDALVVTRRQGERVLLVIEAKRGEPRMLAKHKLGYPTLAIKESLSFDVDQIVPVYLRAKSEGSSIQYHLYECSEPLIGVEQPCLAKLQVRSKHHYEVRIGEPEPEQRQLG